MSALADWAAMGGYAVWVWSAWGLTAASIGALSILTVRANARARARAAALEAELAETSAQETAP
ncbi:MAG: heme exporter protein CcmD [Oceanicaulis sp.]|nr:heme exporter protein CcmD [Oceanicaulis sp.]